MPLSFTGSRIDRADHVRADPERLAGMMGWRARLLALDGLMPGMDDAGALAWTSLADAPQDAELVFLGLDGDQPCFACVPPAGDSAPRMANPALWAAMAALSPDDLAVYGGARSLVDWHARHRFCAQCGHATRLAKGGWQRNCDTDDGGCGAQHFPRTDPVTIMLVEHETEGQNRLLLGRGKGWGEGRFSALAGFVEPGESIEEAVAREVLEESGVAVRDVTYVASQPWPFPSQLMIGCHAYADDDATVMDASELAELRWFTRADIAAALAGADDAPFAKPPPQAIATHLLTWWNDK